MGQGQSENYVELKETLPKNVFLDELDNIQKKWKADQNVKYSMFTKNVTLWHDQRLLEETIEHLKNLLRAKASQGYILSTFEITKDNTHGIPGFDEYFSLIEQTKEDGYHEYESFFRRHFVFLMEAFPLPGKDIDTIYCRPPKTFNNLKNVPWEHYKLGWIYEFSLDCIKLHIRWLNR